MKHATTRVECAKLDETVKVRFLDECPEADYEPGVDAGYWPEDEDDRED